MLQEPPRLDRPRLVPRGEIAIAYTDDPPSLNPFTYEGDTNAARDLLRPVFPTLLSIGPDLRYRPSLAIRVPTGKDLGERPFSVTFHLDPRAKWADGVPVGAGDVRFTWETMLNPSIPAARRGPYARITDVDIVDDRTFRLVFDSAYPGWRDLFSAGDFVIPKHALEGKDLVRQWDVQVPGAGPFVIEKFEPGFRIVYRANARWWGRGPGLERVTVFVVPALETALKLLDQKRVQVIAATSQLNLTQRIARVQGARSRSRFGSAWWELAFNHERSGPDHPDFRKAVAAAFDRAGIAEALIREEGRVLHHLAPSRAVPDSFGPYDLDHDASKQSLGRAGFAEIGGKFTRPGVSAIGLSTPQESEIGLIVERSIFEGMRRMGFQVELKNPRAGVLYGRWRREGSFDLALWERRGTPSQPFSPFYSSKARPPDGVNYYRLASGDVDLAIERLEKANTYRQRDLAEFMRAAAASLPAIPIFEAKAYLGFGPGLSGPDPNATVDGPFWNLHEWVLSA